VAALIAVVFALGLTAGPRTIAADDRRVLVFAAASLKNALDKVNAACAGEVSEEAAISYAATSALAKQIEQGAPADVFFAADLEWMQKLADESLIKAETQMKLLGNEIVLVLPAASSATATIARGFDLAGLIGTGRLAMANVEAVPAGKYGKASLETLGVWDAVKDKVAQAENVRAALALVAIGEAAAGIVYATDAKAESKVTVIGTFPADSHPPIVYPVAQTAISTDENTAAFLTCLTSPKAAEIFSAEGFTVLETP
jgi:molybdate transport system substrate-binding protein